VLSLSVVSPQGPAVTFSDDTFANVDWQQSTTIFGTGTGTVTASQIQSGNPFPARRVTHNFVSSTGVIGIQSHHYMNAAVYDPAVQGAVGLVRYSMDAKNVSTTQRLNWGLRQGTRDYVASGPLTPAMWTTFTSAVLDQNDFLERLPSGVLSQTNHPDFTTAGLPIAFGFEAADAGVAGLVLTVDYDNFSVSINGVPSAVDVRVGSPPNADVFRPVAGAGPVIGTTWDLVVDHMSFLPNADVDAIGLSFVAANVPTSYGVVLCSPLQASVYAPAGTSFAVAIPNHASLLGQTYCIQAASADVAQGVALLTNALDVTIGTF
jgi:hypothetical protein